VLEYLAAPVAVGHIAEYSDSCGSIAPAHSDGERHRVGATDPNSGCAGCDARRAELYGFSAADGLLAGSQRSGDG
jgi:hypothetical protein